MAGQALKVLFEDTNILAIDKPCGIQSIPGGKIDEPNLKNMLEQQTGRRLFTVHRLDKEVSGVIVFAKDAAVHKLISMQFENREITKKYTAVVHGIVSNRSGVIDEPIRQFGSGRMGIDRLKGVRSLTQYEVTGSTEQFTMLNTFPWTGRRHQIRVHLYSIGHPIAGDPIYGVRNIQKSFSRIMLHASEIELVLPGGNRVKIVSGLPGDFIKI